MRAAHGHHPVSPSEARRAPGPGRYDRRLTADERRRRQRDRLLEAAAAVLADSGLAGTTVSRVVRRIGVSRRTFYQHFRDVPHVLLEVLESSSLVLLRRVAAARDAEPELGGKLVAGIGTYLAVVGASAPLTRALYHEIRAVGPEHGRRLEAMRARFVREWRRELRAALRRGSPVRVPDDTVLYALVSAIEAVALQYIDRGDEGRIAEATMPLVDLARTVIFGEARRGPRRRAHAHASMS